MLTICTTTVKILVLVSTDLWVWIMAGDIGWSLKEDLTLDRDVIWWEDGVGDAFLYLWTLSCLQDATRAQTLTSQPDEVHILHHSAVRVSCRHWLWTLQADNAIIQNVHNSCSAGFTYTLVGILRWTCYLRSAFFLFLMHSFCLVFSISICQRILNDF